MSKSESEISKEIQDYLTDNGFFWWRSQVFNGRVKGGYLRTGITGLADITLMLQGSHLYIELKTLTGKQREAQEAFQATCKANGHYYIVARCVSDVRHQLKRMGELV